MGMPSRSLNWATDFFARATAGFCPVMVDRSRTAPSISFASLAASPTPMFTTILISAGDLHHVGETELVPERGRDLGPVALLEPRHRRRFGGHQMSFPLGLATRTLLPSSSNR